MRILIDTINLALERGTGIATYAKNLCQLNVEVGNTVDVLYEFYAPRNQNALLEEMAFYDPQYSVGSTTLDRALEWSSILRQAVWSRPAKARGLRLNGFVDARAIQSRLPAFNRIVTAPLIYRRARSYFRLTGRFMPVITNPMPDIAHWTTPYPLYVPGVRNVYTVHDVIPLKLPYTTLDNRKEYLGLIKGAMRHADQIISVSDTTTRDLLQIAPEAASKITNTSQSTTLPEALRQNSEMDDLLRNVFRIKHKEFFVFIGTIEPKKNIGRLIEAYLGSNSPYPLLIVGKKGWLYEGELRPLSYQSIRTQLDGAEGPSNRVVLVDYVSFPLLVDLMKGARALLFPSLYEGFGLPILEAMLCGTPVMTSNDGAMLELAPPGTALLVNPLDVREMSRAIEQLGSDDALCARLSAAGLNRAKNFAWEPYRIKVLEAYDRAIKFAGQKIAPAASTI